MPTYQYSCTQCGHFFEQVQSFSDDALTTCPECEGRLRKVFNAVGVVFKGSGFYRNDSRKEKRSDDVPVGAAASSKEAGSKDSGSKESRSTESGSKESGSTTSTPSTSASSSTSGSSASTSTPSGSAA